MTKLVGRDGAIYIGDPDDGGRQISARTDWFLSLGEREYVDSRVFGEMNQTYLEGLKNVEFSYTGVLTDWGVLVLFGLDDWAVRLAASLRAALRRKTQRPWYPSDGRHRRRRRKGGRR